MRRGVKVRELMQREGLSGEVVTLFYSGRTGIIHGDDGYDVTFNEESLVVGLAYGDLGIGLRASGSRAKITQDAENAVSARARGGGFGVV